MTDILMPRLTDQMEAGTIIAWLVEDGETVDGGQEIVEIETDKATIAHPADAAGVLGCPIGTVRSRLHRARALLLEKLNQERHSRPGVSALKPIRCVI